MPALHWENVVMHQDRTLSVLLHGEQWPLLPEVQIPCMKCAAAYTFQMVKSI